MINVFVVKTLANVAGEIWMKLLHVCVATRDERMMKEPQYGIICPY